MVFFNGQHCVLLPFRSKNDLWFRFKVIFMGCFWQIILSGLVDTWPARHAWSIDNLSQKYGDTAFRISQRSTKKISMKFKDYAAYMELQHDEDPLYIFDDKVVQGDDNNI